jgi:hypothetical protein
MHFRDVNKANVICATSEKREHRQRVRGFIMSPSRNHLTMLKSFSSPFFFFWLCGVREDGTE